MTGILAIHLLPLGREKTAGSPGTRLKEDQRVEDREEQKCKNMEEADRQEPDILEEIEIEDIAVDGICGVY
jgi:mycofactocin precursor